MKLALSMLCENPRRKTGLTTLFHEFVAHALQQSPDISWLLFAGPDQEWTITDPRIELVRRYPAGDRLGRRLVADHFQVPALARARGASALITVGFVPARKCLPTVMHIFSLQHLDAKNRIGLWRGLYRRWVMAYSWPKADLIITNSDFAVTQIVSVFPQLRGRLIKSYEGLQHEQFRPENQSGETERLVKKLNLAPGYLLWLSNLYPYKQPGLLLQAYALLTPAERAQHPLVMVGGDWEGMLERCRTLAQQLGVSQDVRFLGWIDDDLVAPLYRHALAYCLASREETFGRSVTEAMGCGTPCLVNDIPVMREVTAGSALIVNFNAPTAVVASLRRLMRDPELRMQLRQAGLVQSARFNFGTLTSERIAAIRRLVCAQPA